MSAFLRESVKHLMAQKSKTVKKASTGRSQRSKSARGGRASTQDWGFARHDGVLMSRAKTVQTPLRILCVHGVGDHHTDTAWQDVWRIALEQLIHESNPNRQVAVDFVMYDDILEQYPLNALVIARAIWKLGRSGVVHGVGDLLGRQRGLESFNNTLRWTAGMVAQWADEPELRRATRQRLIERIQATNPQVIIGHSLGSLVCTTRSRSLPAPH